MTELRILKKAVAKHSDIMGQLIAYEATLQYRTVRHDHLAMTTMMTEWQDVPIVLEDLPSNKPLPKDTK